MNKNFTITILFFLSITLSGYIIYDKVINKETNETIISSHKNDNLKDNSIISNKEDEIDNNNLDNNQNINKLDNIELKEYEEIIETQLLKMLGFKSLSETPNQDRLAMLFEVYNNKYNWKEKISINDLEQVKKDSAIKSINIQYTDLKDYNMSTNYTMSPFYNKKGNTYEYSNAGHSENDASIIYKELINSNINKNEIQLSYKFIFARTHIKTASVAPGYHSLYYNLTDEPFKEFSFTALYEEAEKDITYDKAKTYITQNYETIKDNLYTYNFVFTIEDNNIILKDYHRE